MPHIYKDYRAVLAHFSQELQIRFPHSHIFIWFAVIKTFFFKLNLLQFTPHSMLWIYILGCSANWSCTTTSPSRPTSVPQTCFPFGWTGAVLQSRMSSCVSKTTRDSCFQTCSASTWICKAPSKPGWCHPITALLLTFPLTFALRVSQCTQAASMGGHQ